MTYRGYQNNRPLRSFTLQDEKSRCRFLFYVAVCAAVFLLTAMTPHFYSYSEASYLSKEEDTRFVNSQNIEISSNVPRTSSHLLAVGGSDPKTDEEGVAVEGNSSSGGGSPVRNKGEKDEDIYIVRSGDTVSEIAEMFNVEVNTIVWANDLGDHIFEGQHLVILPFDGVRHQVKEDDTLDAIASEYDVSTEDVMEFNDLSEESTLATGDLIDIPGGEKKPSQKEPEPEEPDPPSSSSSYASYKSDQEVAASSGYFSRPVRGGVRTQGLHGRNAVDIAAPVGTPIYAAADGEVSVSGWHSSSGYGYYIVIKHPNGNSTLYAHNSRNLVGVGERVSKGQKIAEMGSTGFSTGSHIHFEVHGAANPF